MNFKEWLLSEMGDIATRDTSNISLNNVRPGVYNYSFFYNGQTFFVNMTSRTELVQEQEVLFYSILFKVKGRDEEYSLTGTAGTSATTIYSQLLMAIKKLLETTQVDGLTYSPADSKMRLVYDRFFRTYLSKDFMRIDDTRYVRKTKLREILKVATNRAKTNFYKSVLNNKRDVNATVKEIKQTKINQIVLKQNVGKFVYVNEENGKKIAYIYEPANSYISTFISHNDAVYRKGFSVNMEFQKFDFRNYPTEQEIKQALINFSKNTMVSIEMTVNPSPYLQKLKEMAENHGIVIRDIKKETKEKENTFVYDLSDDIQYIIALEEDSNVYYIWAANNDDNNERLKIDFAQLIHMDFVNYPRKKTPSESEIKNVLEKIVNDNANVEVRDWLDKPDSKPLHKWLAKFGLKYVNKADEDLLKQLFDD